MDFKESAKGLAGDKWTLGDLNVVSVGWIWTWDKEDRLDDRKYAYLVLYKCVDFEKNVLFELVKCMRRKQHIVLQDHFKYSFYDIVKPFHVVILHYAEFLQEMQNYLPPPSMNGKSYEAASWDVCDKYFSDNEIQAAIKDIILSSMHDKLEKNQEDY